MGPGSGCPHLPRESPSARRGEGKTHCPRGRPLGP